MEAVNGRRFPAAAVLEAAEIKGPNLNNYLSKTPLELCSRSSGQGKARQFCLIDVYQISLLARLASLTGNVQRIAVELNALLWRDVEEAAAQVAAREPGFVKLPRLERIRRMGLAPIDEDQHRHRFCADVFNAPALYHHRCNLPMTYHHYGDSEPLYIYSDDLVLGLRVGPNPAVHDPLFPDGFIVNVTRLLSGVDLRLGQRIWRAETRGV